MQSLTQSYDYDRKYLLRFPDDKIGTVKASTFYLSPDPTDYTTNVKQSEIDENIKRHTSTPPHKRECQTLPTRQDQNRPDHWVQKSPLRVFTTVVKRSSDSIEMKKMGMCQEYSSSSSMRPSSQKCQIWTTKQRKKGRAGRHKAREEKGGASSD